ncbi:hypothetical protein JN06_02344 [Bacteroides zoogleoformans]|uniref:Uncharacterized protein n=1 Tax=Bacteroides zoogleoformans TaxID=28119 RepID=A0ABN5IHW3_9BACE|nr:hypothetical protein C4H11_04840 [Bacteroides zoogleoformans]TWJ11252.1 hypothetical protein JN06_02344 [Bacteroides zoogleoformans]
MYSFKEKKHHFAALRNPAVAGHDLRLLQKANPAEPRLETFKRNPGRYADDILYALLDCVSREEIRDNRRSPMACASHASETKEELKARAEEAEDAREEAEIRAEEAEAAKEVAEQRAEEAEQALEEEKKKLRPRLPQNPKARRVPANRLGQSLRPASANGHTHLQRPCGHLETNEAARRAIGQETG